MSDLTQRDRIRLKEDTADMDAFRGAFSAFSDVLAMFELDLVDECGFDCNCIGCEADARRREVEDLAAQPFACDC